MNVDALIAAYRAAAVAHGQAAENGSTKRCNTAFDELTRIRRELRQAGPDTLRQLSALLEDEDRAVRRSAAVDALEFAPDDAVRVLREVASGPKGMVRLDAEMILEQWEAGEWAPEA